MLILGNWSIINQTFITPYFFLSIWVHLPRLASHWTASSPAEWSQDKPPSVIWSHHRSTGPSLLDVKTPLPLLRNLTC